MSDPRETEQRLRNWLDANQPQRERLCIHLLPLFGDYSNVIPRRPKGGRDGARDIQAVFEQSIMTWGAIGFRNSANDSVEDKKWVKKKFSTDLESALEKKRDLQGFIFFTNVDLTPKEQQDLIEHAREKGITHVDVFYRERLRQMLDSTEGLGYRLQYLRIEMSREEQIAFINRLESIHEKQLRELSKQQEVVDRKLKRIEFLNEYPRPIHTVTAVAILNRLYTPVELGHFRIAVEVKRIYEPSPWPSLFVGGRDSYLGGNIKGKQVKNFGYRSLVWSKEPEEIFRSQIYSARELQTANLRFTGHLYRRGPFETVGEFDRTGFDIFVTRPLLNVIKAVVLVVNDYAVIDLPREVLVTAEQVGLVENNPPDWPEELSDGEKAVEWKRLYIRNRDTENPSLPPPYRHVSREIHFSEFTPNKLGLPAERGGSLWEKAILRIT